MEKELKDSVLAHFNKGDVQAFQKIFEFYYKDIFYFAWKMLSDRQDAQDVAMEIFENLYLKQNTFQTTNNLKAFLYISARNKSIDYLRYREYKHQNQRDFVHKMENDGRLSLERDLKVDLLDLIHAEVSKLPSTCQTIFRKLFYEDLKPIEIAQQMGISVDNVYSQKKRALQILRIELKNFQPVLVLVSLILT